MKIDAQFGVTNALLDQLRAMMSTGSTLDQAIWFLFHANVPKPGVILALRLAEIADLRAAKIAVHRHPAFSFRRETDEEFSENMLQSLETARRDEERQTAA